MTSKDTLWFLQILPLDTVLVQLKTLQPHFPTF